MQQQNMEKKKEGLSSLSLRGVGNTFGLTGNRFKKNIADTNVEGKVDYFMEKIREGKKIKLAHISKGNLDLVRQIIQGTIQANPEEFTL